MQTDLYKWFLPCPRRTEDPFNKSEQLMELRALNVPLTFSLSRCIFSRSLDWNMKKQNEECIPWTQCFDIRRIGVQVKTLLASKADPTAVALAAVGVSVTARHIDGSDLNGYV